MDQPHKKKFCSFEMITCLITKIKIYILVVHLSTFFNWSHFSLNEKISNFEKLTIQILILFNTNSGFSFSTFSHPPETGVWENLEWANVEWENIEQNISNEKKSNFVISSFVIFSLSNFQHFLMTVRGNLQKQLNYCPFYPQKSEPPEYWIHLKK